VVDGDDAVALPDELVDAVDLCAAGADLCAAGLALCVAGLAFALALGSVAAGAAGVGVLAEVLEAGGADGVAGAVAPAGAETGFVIGLEPAGVGDLPEPPVNTSASSPSRTRPRRTMVHRRAPNRAGACRGIRRGRDAPPIRPAPPLRSEPPIRPDARLRALGPTGASASARVGRSPRRTERADGRGDLVAPRLGRADRVAPDAWLIGVPAIRPFPVPATRISTAGAGGSGWGAGISATNTGGGASAEVACAAGRDFGRCVTADGANPDWAPCRPSPTGRGEGSPVASAILASRTASSSGERCGLGGVRPRPFRGS
jgi:hypothetical protein